MLLEMFEPGHIIKVTFRPSSRQTAISVLKICWSEALHSALGMRTPGECMWNGVKQDTICPNLYL